ncbi:MAG: phage terminase large subunit [Sphingomonadales bacterium]|nr:phage terminase large subunit [Sphingomonadales bacterium]
MPDVDHDDAISALARLDFAFFLQLAFRELGGEGGYCHNWHIDAIIHQLNRVRARDNHRLIGTLPPRHLKSRIVSIAWPAWMIGHNPALSFLCVCYGQDLADDHARDCLKIIESKWYRRMFPSLVLTRRAIADIQTSAGGRRMATSVDGATTGFGADVIIVDDPMKAQDAMSQVVRDKINRWFDDTLAQRLNDQLYGSIIVVMQRLHEGDLVGVLKKREAWHELCLPAIATRDEAIPLTRGRIYNRREGCALHPARQPLWLLEQRKAENSVVFAGQYQQAPISEFGNLIEARWLQTFDPVSLDRSQGMIVQSLDTASKDNPFNDYSVCITAIVIGKLVYVIDIFRARHKFTELKAKAIELARLHSAKAMLIEDASSGTALIQSLQADEPLGVPSPIPRRPNMDKISRVMNVSAMIQAGRLFLPERAHWLADFTGELLGFPAARHDDQVDALSQLLIWVQEKDMYRVPLNAGPEAMFSPEERGFGEVEFNGDPWGV